MRATVSFGLAGALAAAGFLYFPAILFGLPLGGLAAALLIRRRAGGIGPRIAATIMATIGCGLTGLIVLFSLISLQARVDPSWGALAWGLGFGIGGAIGGPPLSWLWLPADARSDRVPFAGVIAGLAFAFSGAIGGYLGFQGFSALRFYSLALCLWLAYLLGGLICDVGWKRSLARSGSKLEEADRTGSQREGEAAVSVFDPERRARKSMVWGIVALSLLIFMVASTRWPIPGVEMIILRVGYVPLLMLGIREISHQAALLLLILGAPALFWGVGALLASRRQPGRMSGKGWRRAVIGTIVGTSFVLGGMLLLLPPVTRLFDSLYGRVLLASARATDRTPATVSTRPTS